MYLLELAVVYWQQNSALKSQQVFVHFHVQIYSNIQVRFAPKRSLPIRFAKYNQRHRRTGRHFTGGGKMCPENRNLH